LIVAGRWLTVEPPTKIPVEASLIAVLEDAYVRGYLRPEYRQRQI
jgi:hypothetical protein